jgi:hypothetical protein
VKALYDGSGCFVFFGMKLKYLLMVAASALTLFGLLADKGFTLNLFKVDGDIFDKPDLMVVLEGGAVHFAPTRERANKAIGLYKQYPVAILVCAYRQHKRSIIEHLLLNGVDAGDILGTHYEYEGKEGGGTYNNVLEIISVVKKNSDYKNMLIVTSPYHELRVSLLFSALLEQSEIKRPIYIKYSHITNSEALYTDAPRFVGIIRHELLGIAWFYFRHLRTSIVDYLE